MPHTLQVALPARRQSLYELLERFDAFARGRLPDAVRREIHLALDEIVSNIINHGGDGRRECRFAVDVTVQRGVVRVTVVDDGRAFDPLSAPKPAIDAPLADRPIGGLGVYLVRELMDSVEYKRRNGKNRLRMERRLKAAPDSKIWNSHENTKARKRKSKRKSNRRGR